MNCAECIVNDMSAACKPDGEACVLFHKRLRALLDGNPALIAARAALLDIERRHEKEAKAGGFTECACEICDLIQFAMDVVGRKRPMSAIGAGIFEAIHEGMKQEVNNV